MSILVIDLLCAQPNGEVKFHGGGEYTKTVFKALINSKILSDRIIVCFNKTEFIDKWILDEVNNGKVEFFQVESTLDIINYLKTFKTEDGVRFFAGLSYAYHDYEIPRDIISIGTCHGLRAVEKPFDKNSIKYGSMKKKMKELIRRAVAPYMIRRYKKGFAQTVSKFSYLITDSDHSAYSIKLNFFKETEGKKIFVFYPLTQPILREMDNYNSPSEGYIMMISANRWIKNSYRGVKAIDDLYKKGLIQDIRTKVFGNLPVRIRKELSHPEMFDFYEYVSNEKLEEGYRKCEVLFYPTLNEGFGNVPMEAMKYGKTCIVSAVCSLPEVYKQSVYYCNPYDIMEMQNRILQAIDKKIDTELLRNRIEELRMRQEHDLAALCELIKGTIMEEDK